MPDLKLIPIGRAYASETDAQAAVERLRSSGFDEQDISLIQPSMIRDANPALLDADDPEPLALLVRKVHASADVPAAQASVYAEQLRQQHSVLLLTPPFGKAARADAILDDTGALELGALPPPEFHTWLQPAPLSALLQLPVLAHGRSRLARLFGAPLTEPDFLPGEAFGPLLSSNPTPLSSAAGIKLLSDDPAPLSNAIGMPLLSEDRPANKRSSFGLPLLSERRPAERRTSFGLPMLLRDTPAPLSSLLGLKVLSDDQSGKASVG